MLHITNLARNRVLLTLSVLQLMAIVVAVPVHAAEEPQAAAPAETRATPAPAPDDVKRVMYVPEIVKAQLREEIKQEVLAQAKQENWAAPNAAPEWTKRLKFFGDVRFRWEREIFGGGNDNSGAFIDFGAVDAGAPFDVNFVDTANERYLNVDQNRTRPRLRARLGLDADVGSGFTVGLRLASGDGSTPVSTNQTLGGAPGDFSKYQFWLDRAFIRYAPIDGESGRLAIVLGRFENPFFTTELLWSDNVNFDGVALQARLPIGGGVRPFLAAGAFPLYTTALNFPQEQPVKLAGFNKWLYALQLGADWKPTQSLGVKLGAAFYYFDNIQGRISGPCDTDLKGITCDTDDTRPLFAQKGNTYMALRTPSPFALQQEGLGAPQYQYFGLASRFREVALTSRLEFMVAPPLKVTLEGEVVRNVGFSRKQITAAPAFAPGFALNNRGVVPDDAPPEEVGPYEGGDNAYLVRLTLGSPTQDRRWDWNIGLSYRYLESDAVVDAFNDSDFGLGGTNIKGYVAFGTLAITDEVSAGVRFMSAKQITGPRFGVDVLLVDVSARF